MITESNIVMMILAAFIVAGFAALILIIIIRTALHWYEVKNCVDVDIFTTGDTFQKRESYNCVKVKSHEHSDLYDYELQVLFGRKRFPFYEKFAITRKKDGKTVLNFVEIEGKLVPFIPGAVIETTETTTTEGDNKTTVTTITIKSLIKDHAGTFTTQYMDDLVFRKQKYQIEEFMASKNAKKGIGLLPLLLFIAAGAILLGLILYLLMKGKAPEAKATADASKGMLGGLLPPIQ